MKRRSRGNESITGVEQGSRRLRCSMRPVPRRVTRGTGSTQ